MRQIKASEIKSGMEVEWSRNGVLHRLTPSNVITLRSDFSTFNPNNYGITGYSLSTREGGVQWVSVNQEVTVLSEPAPAQPEEPTTFGAKVRVRDGQFVRLDEPGFRFRLWYEMGTGRRLTWDELCEIGPVQVVPDQGWAAPDTLEVPDRITEWPEDDTALRPYPWRDTLGIVWRHGVTGGESGWSCGSGRAWKGLIFGPFTRVTDA